MGSGENSTTALQDRSKTHDIHGKPLQMCKGNMDNAKKRFCIPMTLRQDNQEKKKETNTAASFLSIGKTTRGH